jgi:RNA-directed DNA polymerase
MNEDCLYEFANTMNLRRGVSMQHVMNEQDSHEQLLERILSSDNMHRAWKRVKENTGAPGVDKMTIEEMPDSLREHWKEIREAVMEETYQPLPVLRKEVPKPTGGTRKLGVPTVLDRLIHQAIAQVLTEIWDPDFRSSVMGSDRSALPTMPSTKRGSTSVNRTTGPWTWTVRSFSTPSTMTC